MVEVKAVPQEISLEVRDLEDLTTKDEFGRRWRVNLEERKTVCRQIDGGTQVAVLCLPKELLIKAMELLSSDISNVGNTGTLQ